MIGIYRRIYSEASRAGFYGTIYRLKRGAIVLDSMERKRARRVAFYCYRRIMRRAKAEGIVAGDLGI